MSKFLDAGIFWAFVNQIKNSTQVVTNINLQPNDGSADVSPQLQTAVNAATARYVATGVPQILYVPPGKYKLTTEVTWRTGVGLVGSDTNGTIFYPYGTQSAFKSLSNNAGDVPLVDCYFAYFTIDGINQADAIDSLSAKGFYLQDATRLIIENVRVKNTWATGIGCGYLRESMMLACTADGCGRGASVSGGDAAGAGAGIANGTGRYNDESCTYVDCSATNNMTCGMFVENKFGGASETKFTAGVSFVNCLAQGNFIGFKDAGCAGLTITGCRAIYNKDCGISLNRSGADASSGVRGVITGCQIGWNGLDQNNTPVTDANANHAGIVLGLMLQGGYLITGNTILSNDWYGICSMPNVNSEIDGPVQIVDNHIYGHNGSGIYLPFNATITNYFQVSRNVIYNNGLDVAQTFRDGVTILATTVFLEMKDNRCFDTQSSPTQQYGIALRGGAQHLAPTLSPNDLRGNAVSAGMLLEANITDVSNTALTKATIIAANLTGAFPATIPYRFPNPDTSAARIRDTFDRSNGGIGSTDATSGGAPASLGSLAWRQNSGVWVTQDKLGRVSPGSGSTTFYASVENSAADMDVQVKMGAGGTTPVGGVIARIAATGTDCLRGGTRSDGFYAISSLASGTTTVLVQTAVAWQAGDTVRLTCVSTTVTLYLMRANEAVFTQIGQALAVAQYLTNTGAGLYGQRATDNFYAHDNFLVR